MHKVLILSDSHGLVNEITVIKERHQIKNKIHCGDSELDLDAPEMEGLLKVAGNCDFDARYPEEQTVDIGGLKFLIVHGHLHGVKGNLTALSYRAEELGAQVACYGHTHVADARQIKNQLFINPGSIRLPRNRTEKTYCIMEWEDINHIDIKYYTLSGEVVEDLSYVATLNP